MKTGEVWATRNDGAVLIYDKDDEYGRALGHIKTATKDYPQHPMIAMLARGGWTLQPVPKSATSVTAAGNSWRWQLRDADGRWVEMGSEVKWLARGRWLTGRVTGSPAPGVATVREASTATEQDIPSNRLEVIGGDMVPTEQAAPREEKGLIDVAPDVPYRNPDYKEQDFDRDVLAPAKVKLDALQVKYPDGVAAALTAALKPAEEPPPEMDDELKALMADPEIIQWREDRSAAGKRLFELEGLHLRGEASNMDVLAAEREVEAQSATRKGGKFLDYQRAQRNHAMVLMAWQVKADNAQRFIMPHSDAAREILADVEEIGRMIREGIEINIAQNEDQGGETTLDQRVTEVTAARLAIIKANPNKKDLSADEQRRYDELSDERLRLMHDRVGLLRQLDVQKTQAEIRRKELARRVVAELVGVPTETKQTWESKEPSDRGKEVHRALIPAEKEAMTTGLLRYPASWVQRFDTKSYTTSYAGRAWHRETDWHIAISNVENGGVEAAIQHEQGHGMEQLVPGLAGLEAIFWHNRMGEDSEKALYADDGAFFPLPSGPDRKNIARPTSRRYTMKVYGNVYEKDNKSWEVFTTGVQEVLGSGRTEYTQRRADWELWDFTMGALLTLDGRDG